MLRAALQTAVSLIYPPRCLGCGGLVESDFGLCPPCWGDTWFLSGLVCDGCGAPLPGASDRAEHCDDCLKIARPWARGRAALVYTGTGRRMVLALKHGDRHDIAAPAARWMARAAQDLMPPGTVIVPVPLHLTRLAARRYNQSALLAQALARHTGHTLCLDALRRAHRTPSLGGRSRDERFATLAGAIVHTPKRAKALEGRPVLIVDDVMTSGATLAAATEAAHAAGASGVCVCTLARAVKDA